MFVLIVVVWHQTMVVALHLKPNAQLILNALTLKHAVVAAVSNLVGQILADKMLFANPSTTYLVVLVHRDTQEIQESNVIQVSYLIV